VEKRRQGLPTQYLQDAQGLDMGKPYWSDPAEMFARAFESFVEDELHKKGRKNTYLVDGTRVAYESDALTQALTMAEPYPQGAERERINNAMRNLMKVLAEDERLFMNYMYKSRFSFKNTIDRLIKGLR